MPYFYMQPTKAKQIPIRNLINLNNVNTFSLIISPLFFVTFLGGQHLKVPFPFE